MAVKLIWVLAEAPGGRVSSVACELLTKARSMGSAAVEAVCFGADAGEAAAELGKYGAQTVYLSTDPAFTELLWGGPAASTLAGLVGEHHPDLILFAGTYASRDVAGRLAAKLDVPVIANGCDVAVDGTVSVMGSIFGGTRTVRTEFGPRTPALVLIQPKSFRAEETGHKSVAEVVEVRAVVEESHHHARIVERTFEATAGPRLEEAAVVVSGGRGMQDPKNFALLEEVAALLHGAVGASRAAVDAGWAPYAMQIGQTGKTVRPTLYMACGISGAVQHTVGMMGASSIVAVNKDPEAAIFKLADLGIVGDALAILERLISELKSRAAAPSAPR